MLPAGGAVVLESFPGVLAAAGERLLRGAGKQREGLRSLAAGLRGTGGRGSLEHALEHFWILGAVAAAAEVAGDIRRGHGTDGLDAIVAGRRGEHVAARAADPERADPL